MPPDSIPTTAENHARHGDLRQLRVPLLILATLAILTTLHLARSLLIPIALALFFAMLLSPAVNRLRIWRLPRALGAALVMLIVLGGFVAVIETTLEPAREWLERAPSVLSEMERKIRPLQRMAVKLDQVAAHAERVAEGGAASSKPAATAPARRGMLLLQTPAVIITIASTFFLTLFLLAWGPPLLAKVAGSVNDPRAEGALQVLAAAQREIAQYLGTVALINVGLGIATAGLTAAFGLPTPVLWGVLAAALNFIPYAGSAVTLCVVTVVALLTQAGVGPAVGVALSYLALATIEGQLVQPLAVGRRLSLSPLLVFIALWFWGWLWGVAGLLLATPMLLALKAISCQVTGMERIARVLSPPPVLPRVLSAAERWRRKTGATRA